MNDVNFECGERLSLQQVESASRGLRDGCCDALLVEPEELSSELWVDLDK
jgi:hypothetical protein